jgi:hypothetical protein
MSMNQLSGNPTYQDLLCFRCLDAVIELGVDGAYQPARNSKALARGTVLLCSAVAALFV